MKRLVIITIIALGWSMSNAQQSVLTTQHWIAKNIYNPASAGTMDFMHGSILFRKQWVGFDGSPTSGIFTFDVPFHEQHMGAGLTITEDQVGVTNRTDISGNYHYHLRLSKDWKLAFGAKAAVSFIRASYTDHTAWDADDPKIRSDRSNWLPNFGFGTYLWKDEYTYVGFGIPEVLSYNPDDMISVQNDDYPNLERHYYLNAGYAFDIDENWAIQPNTMMRFVPGAPFQFDIGAMGVYNEFLAGGLSYRLKDCLSAMLRARIADHFVLGYAFDITVTDMRKHSSGSHEAYISYRFGEKENTSRALFGG